MQAVGMKRFKIILMEDKKPDVSARSNPGILQKMAPSVPFISVPNLGFRASSAGVIKINASFLKITLARILKGDILDIVLPKEGRKNCSTEPLTTGFKSSK
jgi:hypothetical protein